MTRTQTAGRHRAGITPGPSAQGKRKLGEIQAARQGVSTTSPDALSLMEAWLAVRRLSVVDISRASGISDQTIYNLIECPGRARHATLEAIAAAMSAASGQVVTADQVAALAHRRVVDPDRVSEEIRDTLAAGLRVG